MFIKTTAPTHSLILQLLPIMQQACEIVNQEFQDYCSGAAFDVEKKRVIFNLNYSKEIQLSGGVYTISSDFCYWDFQTEDEFDENVKNLVNMASNISI